MGGVYVGLHRVQCCEKNGLIELNRITTHNMSSQFNQKRIHKHTKAQFIVLRNFFRHFSCLFWPAIHILDDDFNMTLYELNQLYNENNNKKSSIYFVRPFVLLLL